MSELNVSKPVHKLLVIFLIGLFAFWGVRVYEILTETEGDYPREISVEATGKAFVVPDTAKITLGVYSEGETSDQVLQENTEKMNDVISMLDEFDIPKEDIKTTNFNLYPNYQWDPDDGRYLDGYRLDQNVEVKMKDFEIVGEVIAASTTLGANQVGGVRFVVDDPETAKTEARLDAIEKVRAKAASIAEASGLKLGKVLSYYEYAPYGKGDYNSYDVAYALEDMGAMREGPMIEAGQQEVTLTVTLSYRVK